MPEIILSEKVYNLSDLGNVVPEGYEYHEKNFTPGLLLNVRGACLKWYNLYPPETGITDEQVNEARSLIKSEADAGMLKLENELGFVILHRAGDYLLLLISTWRLTNEIWESIYLKKAGQAEEYKRIKFNDEHRGTYCVWELGAVWHERNAWVKFIQSNRDEAAKQAYLNDVFAGTI
jgi:hypothetical protein